MVALVGQGAKNFVLVERKLFADFFGGGGRFVVIADLAHIDLSLLLLLNAVKYTGDGLATVLCVFYRVNSERRRTGNLGVLQEGLRFRGLVDNPAPVPLVEFARLHVLNVDGSVRHAVTVNDLLFAAIVRAAHHALKFRTGIACVFKPSMMSWKNLLFVTTISVIVSVTL